VLSTVHTNDSAGALTRLVDMGVEPFLVASSLVAFWRMRLLRRLCPHCKEPYVPRPRNCRKWAWFRMPFLPEKADRHPVSPG
jgi:type II secretory ATPase GspE/PulE/Tfp pilus assembly ATPase PilB-like protein